MRWLVFALVASGAVVRADFVPPAEGPVPFRRDKLPVDVDTMGTLSRQITALTGAGLPADAPGLRSAAQMAALALALDPANRQARDLIEKLSSGGSPDKTEAGELERARSRSWQVLGWLEMPEAGPDGQALAACLGDVLTAGDPDHPLAKEHRESGERGAWKDWVAPEAAFRKKEPEPKPEPKPDPKEEKTAERRVIALEKVSADVPLWLLDKKTKALRLEIIRVGTEATESTAKNGITLKWDVDKLGTPPVMAGDRIEKLLTARHENFDGGLIVDAYWKGGQDYARERNGSLLSGTMATLLDATLTGKPPTAMTMAVVGENGKLELPPGFWGTLRALSALKEKNRTIVFPAKAEEYLAGLLVLDDAAFFMDNEVLLASNANELCDLASGAPAPAIAEALAAFGEIRKVGQGKALGSFVALPATQARLNKVAATMPQHASARFLALQGSGSRPRYLQRPLLAREIRDALEPISYLFEETTAALLPPRLDQVHQKCREKLDSLSSVIDIRDRDLQKAAVGAADAIRTLARTLEKTDRDYTVDLNTKKTQLHASTKVEYVRVLGLLTEAAGDSAEFVMPKLPAER